MVAGDVGADVAAAVAAVEAVAAAAAVALGCGVALRSVRETLEASIEEVVGGKGWELRGESLVKANDRVA